MVCPRFSPAMMRTGRVYGRSALQRLPRFEQRLQAAQDVHPTAGDALGGLRGALELVVDDRQLRHAAVLRLNLPRYAARLLRCELRVVLGSPHVHELVRRLPLDDGLVAPQLSVGTACDA